MEKKQKPLTSIKYNFHTQWALDQLIEINVVVVLFYFDEALCCKLCNQLWVLVLFLFGALFGETFYFPFNRFAKYILSCKLKSMNLCHFSKISYAHTHNIIHISRHWPVLLILISLYSHFPFSHRHLLEIGFHSTWFPPLLVCSLSADSGQNVYVVYLLVLWKRGRDT